MTKDSIEFLLSILNVNAPTKDRSWTQKLWKAEDELKAELATFKKAKVEVVKPKIKKKGKRGK